MGKKSVPEALSKAKSAASELYKLADAVVEGHKQLEQAKHQTQSEIHAKLKACEEAKQKVQKEIDAKLKACEEAKQKVQKEIDAKLKAGEEATLRAHTELQNELSEKRKAFDEKLQAERAVLNQDRKNLEKEIALMNTLGEGSHDLVHLNVGGKLMTVKRSTLCQHKGSMLANMFSGRWEQSLDRDEKNRVFFDFIPEHFQLILNHLRDSRSPPAKVVRVVFRWQIFRNLTKAFWIWFNFVV